MQNCGEVAINVDGGILNGVVVHHVISEHLEPSRARHHGVSGLHQDQRIVVVEHCPSGRLITVTNAPFESVHRGLEILRHTFTFP